MCIQFLSCKVVSLRVDTMVSTRWDRCIYTLIRSSLHVETLQIRLFVSARLSSDQTFLLLRANWVFYQLMRGKPCYLLRSISLYLIPYSVRKYGQEAWNSCNILHEDKKDIYLQCWEKKIHEIVYGLFSDGNVLNVKPCRIMRSTIEYSLLYGNT